MAMKAACIVAFLTAFVVSAETIAGTEAEACQSGSLIQQRLGSSHAVLPEETEAPGPDTAKTMKPLEKKKLQKRKKLEKMQKFSPSRRCKWVSLQKALNAIQQELCFFSLFFCVML